MSDFETDFERVIREKEQQEQLKRELLEAATKDWLTSANHSYAESAEKYGFDRRTLRNYIQAKYKMSKRKKQEDRKDTDNAIVAIDARTLRIP